VPNIGRVNDDQTKSQTSQVHLVYTPRCIELHDQRSLPRLYARDLNHFGLDAVDSDAIGASNIGNLQLLQRIRPDLDIAAGHVSVIPLFFGTYVSRTFEVFQSRTDNFEL
jgi:hypothetical protein